MSYIGREPQIGNFQMCDAISVVNNQAAYTMQVGGVAVIPNGNFNVICSLNGVIQKSGTSFVISSSTITFSQNLVTGDVIDFILILGSVLDLGVPSDGTVTTGKIVNSNITTQKIADNAITSEKLASGLLPTNTPSFFAYRTANQSIASDSHTKLEMNIEAYDTNSAYDNSSNYRFTVPSGQGGKYAIGAYCKNNNLTASTKVLSIYKNGSAIFSGQDGNNTAYATLQASTIAVLDAGDYLELYGFQTVGSSQVFVTGGLNTSGFFGYKLIGV